MKFHTLSLKRFLKNNFLYLIVLAVLPLIVYLPSINATFVSDDVFAIPQNPNIGSFVNIKNQLNTFTQPLLYMVAFKIGGLNPIPFRLINILFHIGNVLLIYALVYKMKNRFVAFYTASLFAVHPILTESVTWISGANYSRYTFFFLLSFLSFLLAQKDRKWYIVSLVSFTLSFFSSEKALAIPFVFLLYIIVFQNKKKYYYPLVGYFAIFSGFLLYYLTRVGERLGHLGAVQYAQESTIYNYNQLLQIPIAVTMYLQLIFFPKNLTVYHTEVVSYPELFIRSLVFLAFILITFFWYKREKLLFFWSSFFLITLIPTLTPWGLSSSVAERYTYLGSIGIFFIAGYGIYYLHKKLGQKIAISIITILLISLGIRTIIRNRDYISFESFWISTAAVSPLSYQAQNNVGIIKAQLGDLDGALVQFKKAIEIVPNSAQAYQNMGSVFFTAKKYPEALKYYEKTIKLYPAAWVAYQNMAAIYFEQGDFTKAEEFTKQAIKINPQNPSLYNNLSLIYIKNNQPLKARELLEQALKLDPNNMQTQQMLQIISAPQQKN